MPARLFIVAAAVGFAAIVSAVQSLSLEKAPFKTLIYRTYLINTSGKEFAVTEERYELKEWDLLKGRIYYSLTVTDLTSKTVLEKNVRVVTTARGNLIERGRVSWVPFEPRIPENRDQHRLDYVEREGTKRIVGSAYMLILKELDREYAGRVFKILKVRSDITESGMNVRYKCTYIPTLHNIGSCRFESGAVDEEIRLVGIEY